MDCNEARPLLDASADRELPAPQARRVQQHVDGCDACRRDSDALRTLSRSLRATRYHRAPDALRARIIAGLPQGDAPAVAGSAAASGAMPVGQAAHAPTSPRTKPGARRFAWLRWLPRFDGKPRLPRNSGVTHGEISDMTHGSGAPGALAGRVWLIAGAIALCAATAGVTFNLRGPASPGRFADELVESHVRAQLSGHGIDVISTDRHTVKPWFNGRLDYTPPVEDLAASGFALEGGRLDYVAHRRVAVLVYRFDKHLIDVYVFPSDPTPDAGRAPASALSRDGYALAHWTAHGMIWWAVTDAAPDTLGGLEAALKARLSDSRAQTEGG